MNLGRLIKLVADIAIFYISSLFLLVISVVNTRIHLYSAVQLKKINFACPTII